MKGIAKLEINFGVEIPKEKSTLLFNFLEDEGWSNERFNRTLQWFLRKKIYPNWSIADWTNYEVKLYTFDWIANYCHKEGFSSTSDFIENNMQGYIINGIRLWKFLDGDEDLPFPKIPPSPPIYCEYCGKILEKREYDTHQYGCPKRKIVSPEVVKKFMDDLRKEFYKTEKFTEGVKQ